MSARKGLNHDHIRHLVETRPEGQSHWSRCCQVAAAVGCSVQMVYRISTGRQAPYGQARTYQRTSDDDLERMLGERRRAPARCKEIAQSHIDHIDRIKAEKKRRKKGV